MLLKFYVSQTHCSFQKYSFLLLDSLVSSFCLEFDKNIKCKKIKANIVKKNLKAFCKLCVLCNRNAVVSEAVHTVFVTLSTMTNYFF